MQILNLLKVKLLILFGSDLDSINSFGFTPLNTALHNQNYNLAKLLIDDGDTLLHLAVRNQDQKLIKLLKNNYSHEPLPCELR